MSDSWRKIAEDRGKLCHEYRDFIDELHSEIARLRTQIEQERAVRARLNDEVERLTGLLRRCTPHVKTALAAYILDRDPHSKDGKDAYSIITEIEALR